MKIVAPVFNNALALRNPVVGDSDASQGNYDSVIAVPDLVAAVIATYIGADQDNINARGVDVVVDVTAVGGLTPQVIVTIEGKDPRSGKYYPLLASAALVAAGTVVLTVYPGATVAANIAVSRQLPRTWRAKAVVSGGAGATITATVSASVVL